MQEQRQNKEFAILYRTNAQSRSIEDALRKRDIPYRVYGGLSFYQRKEIKDLLAYLRLLVNHNDEESLKRIINYPARGIGQTTLDKLIIGAKNNDMSLFETVKNSSKLNLSLNGGILKKLSDFSNFIMSLQIENQKSNAFEITDLVVKRTALVLELKKDGTPEGVSKIENIEELLNGILDFVEGQKEIADTNGSLAEFLEDISLATDFDNDNNDDIDRVSLMTVHLSKGLEFPIVYIVGLEEDLFPSALSLNTRNELEEERRLFYVALTRAEEKAFISYALTRYRWGKLVDGEPSRFIDEMDEDFLDYVVPKDGYIFKPILDKGIFGEVTRPLDKSVSTKRGVKVNTMPSQKQLGKLRKINSDEKPPTVSIDPKLTDLQEGVNVEHLRFGYGKVLKIEGNGNDKKALIDFKGIGKKNLLLRFAKLKIKG
jgi:DNA helicase-2/ATP-dependent DNA helicase PcrA